MDIFPFRGVVALYLEIFSTGSCAEGRRGWNQEIAKLNDEKTAAADSEECHTCCVVLSVQPAFPPPPLERAGRGGTCFRYRCCATVVVIGVYQVALVLALATRGGVGGRGWGWQVGGEGGFGLERTAREEAFFKMQEASWP